MTGEWTLSNCPEPSTLVLAGMAVAGIVVRRMRRGV
ncbi:MAG: PEP-CTERM sorting domain-containing protein [Planctomycetaceae bacterium]